MSLTQEFRDAIRTEDLHAAMRLLNRQVPYRFSAVFRFEKDILRNICLIDKYDRDVTRCEDQPICDSYCIYIHRSGERFTVEESTTDSRVDGHPKCRSYQSYYGVPLFSAAGHLWGTACHFDTLPVRVTDEIVSMLDDVAPLIASAAEQEDALGKL